MKKLTSTILGAAILVGASFAVYAAPAPVTADGAPGTYYWWNHPRLGMVKVDRATNAMVNAKRSTETAKQAAESGTPSR